MDVNWPLIRTVQSRIVRMYVSNIPGVDHGLVGSRGRQCVPKWPFLGIMAKALLSRINNTHYGNLIESLQIHRPVLAWVSLNWNPVGSGRGGLITRIIQYLLTLRLGMNVLCIVRSKYTAARLPKHAQSIQWLAFAKLGKDQKSSPRLLTSARPPDHFDKPKWPLSNDSFASVEELHNIWPPLQDVNAVLPSTHPSLWYNFSSASLISFFFYHITFFSSL